MMTISSHLRPSVFHYLKERIHALQNAGHPGTARNYLSALRSLQRFRQGLDIALEDTDAHLVDDYDAWMQRRGLSRNTRSFYLRILRAVLNHAAGEGIYIPDEPSQRLFRHVYTGVDRTTKRAAHLDVLEALRTLPLDGPVARRQRLTLARDLFFFSFYTRGMAFVDIAYLRRENVRGGLITYARHKTHQLLSISIEPCIRRILNRYYFRPGSNGYIFPIIRSDHPEAAYRDYRNALSTYNRALACLGRMLARHLDADGNMPSASLGGAWRPTLSSYVARHTWASLAHDVDVPLRVISQSLGHANERTTQIYLAELNREVIDSANQRVLALVEEENCREEAETKNQE